VFSLFEHLQLIFKLSSTHKLNFARDFNDWATNVEEKQSTSSAAKLRKIIKWFLLPVEGLSPTQGAAVI